MKTTVFDISGVYDQEKVLDLPGLEILDFRNLSGANCYCDQQAEALLSEAAARSDTKIHWIDTGDYHYISLFYARLIEEPFSLVLFDHHSDEQTSAFGALSCGSWVSELKSSCPMLKELISVGPEERYEFRIPKYPAYVSIDLDVLSKAEIETDWDQGKLTLDALESCLGLLQGKKILGIDLCGGLTREKGASDCMLARNAQTRCRIQDILKLFF